MRQGIGFLFFLGLSISIEIVSQPWPGKDQEHLLQMARGLCPYRMKKFMQLTRYTRPEILELKPYTKITRTMKLNPPKTKKPKAEKF